MKKKLKNTILFLSFLSTSVYSFSINNVVEDTVGNITGGLTSQLGIPEFSVKCDVGIENIDLYKMCDIVGRVEDVLGGDFSIGGCTIKAADPLTCQKNALKDFCNDTLKKLDSKSEKYALDSTNSIVSSSEELIGTGGKIIGNFTNCNYVSNVFQNKKTQSGKTLKEVYEESSVEKLQKHGIFSTVAEDVRDCLKSTKYSSKCFTPEKWILPDNMEKVEEKISKTVEQATPVSTEYIKSSLETESKMAKEMNSKCSDLDNSSSCIKNVLNKDGEHAKKRDAAIANIETSSAVRKKIINNASKMNKGMVYRGGNIINKLPIEMRGKYIDAVKRANASDILTTNLYSENVSLSKESIIILDNKIVDSSEPFMSKSSIKKIKSLMGGGEEGAGGATMPNMESIPNVGI